MCVETDKLIPSFTRTLQTFTVHQFNINLLNYEVEGLVRRLETLVDAKNSSPNGAFASLTEICLASLSVASKTDRWGPHAADKLDPWLGGLKHLCKESEVKLLL